MNNYDLLKNGRNPRARQQWPRANVMVCDIFNPLQKRPEVRMNKKMNKTIQIKKNV